MTKKKEQDPNEVGKTEEGGAPDFERFGLPQNYTDMVSVQKHVLAVRVGKPPKQSYIRTHHNPDMQFGTFLLESEHDRATYLVEPYLYEELARELVPKMLYASIDRENNPFLWAVKLPDALGQLDSWNESAHRAAQEAQTKWVRVLSNQTLKAYEVVSAKAAELPEPVWPDLGMQDLLKIAFAGQVIDSLDHEVIRRLRGEI